jgi:hypothetical protein
MVNNIYRDEPMFEKFQDYIEASRHYTYFIFCDTIKVVETLM